MSIYLHDATSSYHPYIDIAFFDPPSYIVGYCSLPTEFTMPPGVENVRLWTVIQAGERLLLLCNGELIFDRRTEIKYGPDCPTKWDRNFEYIYFDESSDQPASDYYREFKTGKQNSEYQAMLIIFSKICRAA